VAPPDALALAARGMFLLVAAALVLGFAWILQPAVKAQRESACRPLTPQARSGAALPLAVQDLTGKTVGWEDFAGKFVVLNFWATWCEPCTLEWPELDQLAERLGARDDVVVLAVSIDDDLEAVRRYVERMALVDTRVRVLWDPTKQLATSYGSPKLPDTYFVGRDAQLRQVFVNTRRWGTPGALACVEAAADAG
jgi:peroxiredoxin